MNVYKDGTLILANMSRPIIHRKDGKYVRYKNKLYKLHTIRRGVPQPTAFIEIGESML